MITKTVYVTVANHFDLVWRRCWERPTDIQGRRFIAYRRLEELILDRCTALAEAGAAAVEQEQVLPLRRYLERHPDARARWRALTEKGLWEVFGGGEAVIDTNLCGSETLVRNLASGTWFSRERLGLVPEVACFSDAFGTSAQVPQIVRGCGFRAVRDLAYSKPDQPYWRGLDGSVVHCRPERPGRVHFFDHCYQEPCPRCRGFRPQRCARCQGTGLNRDRNWYPPMAPPAAGEVPPEGGQLRIFSEEMLPPTDLPDRLAEWARQAPELRFLFGTQCGLTAGFAAAEALVDAPPPALVSSRVENNPTQTGCYVSRLRVKQEGRRCEAVFYGWETALAVTLAAGAHDVPAWESLFLELPLFFFHDAVTGTHQDEAYRELRERMAAMRRATAVQARRELRLVGRPAVRAPVPAAGRCFAVFDPGNTPGARRIPLPPEFAAGDGRWVAEDAAGRAWPVVPSWHAASLPAPLPENRLLTAVGPTAATRPPAPELFLEAADLAPLAWNTFTLRPAPAPTVLSEPVLRNPHLEVRLGDHGISGVTEVATGARIGAPSGGAIGELLLQEDEGDPWGVRKIPAWRRGLGEFTRFLGARQFAGYQEAWFAGVYEPCLRFGREADPRIFALEWYVTVRLPEHARRVDISHEIYWKSADRRLRVRIPVGTPTDTAWYGIPGGWLARPRYEQTATHLFSPDGDWPATTFVAAAPGSDGTGWAVVNYGTPACRVEDGAILVSVLRSPAFGHCLERYAQNYPMPVSGIRDGGWRHVTLSLIPHRGEADLPRLAVAAAGLNLAPPAIAVGKRPGALPVPAWPLQITGAPVELAAIKFPFDGAPGARIVRLINPAPQAAAATLHLPPERRGTFHRCDLLEQPGDLVMPASPGCWPLTLRPFQILTLRWQSVTG